jgi:hypothetical protein
MRHDKFRNRAANGLCAALVAVLAAVPAQADGSWVDLANMPGCSVWNDNPQEDERAVWTGDCTDGRASGEGTLTWLYMVDGEPRQALYQGTYKDGREHGYGVFNWPGGDFYDGMWKDGRLHGEGKFSFADGRFCAGVWQFGALRAGDGFDGDRVRRCRIDGRGLSWLDK